MNSCFHPQLHLTRALAIATASCSLLLNSVPGQVKPAPVLEPTALEALANQPTAKVRWSEEIGRVSGDEATVIITALSIEDVASPGHRMRGIRIDLANRTARDHVFIEENELQSILRALREIENEIDSLRKEPADAPYQYQGAAYFWRPHQRVHTLNAAFYIAPDSSGLAISAYKQEEYRFPNHRPAELAALIERAMTKLRHRGRNQ